MGNPVSTSGSAVFSKRTAVFPGFWVLPGLARRAPALGVRCLFPSTQDKPSSYLFPGRGVSGLRVGIQFGPCAIRTLSSPLLRSEPGKGTPRCIVYANAGQRSHLGSGFRTYSLNHSERQASIATRVNRTHPARTSGARRAVPATSQAGWMLWRPPGPLSALSLPWIFLGASSGPSSALEEERGVRSE